MQLEAGSRFWFALKWSFIFPHHSFRGWLNGSRKSSEEAVCVVGERHLRGDGPEEDGAKWSVSECILKTGMIGFLGGLDAVKMWFFGVEKGKGESSRLPSKFLVCVFEQMRWRRHWIYYTWSSTWCRKVVRLPVVTVRRQQLAPTKTVWLVPLGFRRLSHDGAWAELRGGGPAT